MSLTDRMYHIENDVADLQARTLASEGAARTHAEHDAERFAAVEKRFDTTDAKLDGIHALLFRIILGAMGFGALLILVLVGIEVADAAGFITGAFGL